LRRHRDFPGDDASDITGVVNGIKPGISRENADYNKVDLHSDLEFVRTSSQEKVRRQR
jgi:hypothetical protein